MIDDRLDSAHPQRDPLRGPFLRRSVDGAAERDHTVIDPDVYPAAIDAGVGPIERILDEPLHLIVMRGLIQGATCRMCHAACGATTVPYANIDTRRASSTALPPQRGFSPARRELLPPGWRRRPSARRREVSTKHARPGCAVSVGIQDPPYSLLRSALVRSSIAIPRNCDGETSEASERSPDSPGRTLCRTTQTGCFRAPARRARADPAVGTGIRRGPAYHSDA